MRLLRRAKARQHEQREKQDVWLTFYPQNPQSGLADGFGTLESLNEVSLEPGARVVMPPYRDAEVVTYVREGRLTFSDGNGCRGTLQAGEYLRMTASRAFHPNKTNASRSGSVHYFQKSAGPSAA